jgi:RNA polymerase subunit RPABC4/transcription elongation factor Spt4
VGYVCRACNWECDNVVHSKPGTCPVCGMNLAPKFAVKK